MNVSSLLLSQTSGLMKLQDARGLKPLHLAARNGHTDMVASLISQGSDINTSDNHGWVPLHHATRCGQLSVVKLLLELGASVTHATRDDRVPLSLSAASGHVDVFMYLLNKEHDTDALLEDKKFILDLMICGRTNQQKAIEEFILVSESPLETSAKLFCLFSKRATLDMEHQKDLELAAMFCERVTGQLMDIGSNMSGPSKLLKAQDAHGNPYIDILVDAGLKEVVAQPAVQRYLTDVWQGDLGMSGASLGILFVLFIICPPVLVLCSLPVGQRLHSVPIIKFMAYAAAHVQFIVVLISVVVIPLHPLPERESHWPTWNEYVLLLWLAGNLTSELTNPSNGAGGRIVKTLTLALSSVAALLQVIAIGYGVNTYESQMLMYCRNLVLSLPVMISVLQIIEILTFSKSFGPLTIILQYMIQESSVSMVIMMVFFIGWWFALQTIYTPICPDAEPELTSNCTCNVRVPAGCEAPYLKNNLDGVTPGCWSNSELLTDPVRAPWILGVYHGLMFQHEDILWYSAIRNSPQWTTSFIQIHMALFHIIMVLIILMLVISISADTLERLMAKSDLEWQFERAKLIRNMSKTAPTPPPVNVFVKPVVYLMAFIKHKGLLCTSYAPYYIMVEEGTGESSSDQTDNAKGADFAFVRWIQDFIGWMRKRTHGSAIESLMARARRAHSIVYQGGTLLTATSSELRKRRKQSLAQKRIHEHLFENDILKDVLNWTTVVDRFREAEAEESEDEYIDQIGCFKSELELWQADMWDEADDIEDDEERLTLREWLVEEFKDVVKSS